MPKKPFAVSSEIRAIATYKPRVVLQETVQKNELVRYISSRSGLNEGAIDHVIKELRDAVSFFNLAARPVNIEGLGMYFPTIDTKGVFGVGHRLDKWLKNQLNNPGTFAGKITNQDMIGKTTEEYFARWNEEHPDEPI